MTEQHLSTQEVCLFLGISLSTFYRYCKRGLLKPSFLTIGGHRRFSIQELNQTIKTLSLIGYGKNSSIGKGFFDFFDIISP